MQLQNYACGQWVAVSEKQTELLDASTGRIRGLIPHSIPFSSSSSSFVVSVSVSVLS